MAVAAAALSQPVIDVYEQRRNYLSGLRVPSGFYTALQTELAKVGQVVKSLGGFTFHGMPSPYKGDGFRIVIERGKGASKQHVMFNIWNGYNSEPEAHSRILSIATFKEWVDGSTDV